jgi:polyphosphate kinase
VEASLRYDDYTRARDEMLLRTDIAEAPWYVVDAEDQRRARLNAIAHLLETVPHRPREPEALELDDSPAAGRTTPPPEGIRRVPERW